MHKSIWSSPNENNRAVITGSRGLLGSAFVRALSLNFPAIEIFVPPSQYLDLRDAHATRNYFDNIRPAVVIHCAGTVGGIKANANNPWSFLMDNAQMALNVVEACRHGDVQHFAFMGSACAYPSTVDTPIFENELLTGPPQQENRPYALAKLLGIEATRVCFEEGRDFTAFMPCNLYGWGDNYHPEHSHVIPGLFYKFARAREAGVFSVHCWGDGGAERDFICSDDAAYMVLRYLSRHDIGCREPLLNITTEQVYSIRWLAKQIRRIVHPEAQIEWGGSSQNGQQCRWLSGDLYRVTVSPIDATLPSRQCSKLERDLQELWDRELSLKPTSQWKQKAVRKA
jgi:GDP-L-fucose synthase